MRRAAALTSEKRKKSVTYLTNHMLELSVIAMCRNEKAKKKYSRVLLKIQSVNSEKKESDFHTTGLLLGKEA